MAKSTTNGNCYECGVELGKIQMRNHLLKEHCTDGDEPCYLLVIEGRYKPNYWLILDIALDRKLSSLDSFLRRIWLECCDHLSEFKVISPKGKSADKTRSLRYFAVGDKLEHIYDFGTSTETRISIVAKTLRPKQKEAVRLLARNIKPSFECRECGKPATGLCQECGGFYKGMLFCDECYSKHPCCNEFSATPITNSPRCGQCGYAGELDTYEFNSKTVKKISSEQKSSGEKANTPTSRQWARLYELANEIRTLEPWKKLYDSDWFSMMLPSHKEPILVSVMGRNGECYGIGVYPGYLSIQGLYRIGESPCGDSYESAVRILQTQNNLLCYYGERNELERNDLDAIKSLNLKFGGQKNAYPFFRSSNSGFIPWFINAAQAELLAEVLEHFIGMYNFTKEKKLKFNDSQTPLLRYDKKLKRWTIAIVDKIPMPMFVYKLNPKILSELKNIENVTTPSLELDMLYYPRPTQKRKNDRPFFPRVLALFETKSGFALKHKMLEPTDDAVKKINDFLIEYIRESGKIKELRIRDKYFLQYIRVLCDKLGISVKIDEGMPNADLFYSEMVNSMGVLEMS